ncbi:MAG: hypothetical protein JEY94_13705 [Melioribacteraceae bacterium]|nr:hypothetical protein [Melioribacteraceae bacterium]
MISSVSNNGMQPPPPKQSQPLSDEQKTSLNDIVSKYDPSSISKSDFETMMTEIKEAGITPSKELKGFMEEAGFEMPEGGPRGAKGSGRPEPPQFMKDLIKQLETGDISEDELKSFIESFKNGNDDPEGTLVDKYV